MPTITQAGWIAYDVNHNLLAQNTLSVSVPLNPDAVPEDIVKAGTALYNTLHADAIANPTVAAYPANPLPSTTLYPGYAPAMPFLEYQVTKIVT